MIVEVEVRGAPATTQRFDAGFDRRVIIGRASTCDLVVHEAGVSRKHTMLIATPGGWRVQDLGSSNGTYLNGARVDSAPFTVGDVVSLGQVRIKLVSPELPDVRVLVDLEAGSVSVSGVVLPLSAAELIWFGFLALARSRGDGWVVAGREGHSALAAFTAALLPRPWAEGVKTKPLLDLARGVDVDDEDLKNLRGKTAQKLKAFCVGDRAWVAALVVPEVQGKNRQRVPGACEVRGAPAGC